VTGPMWNWGVFAITPPRFGCVSGPRPSTPLPWPTLRASGRPRMIELGRSTPEPARVLCDTVPVGSRAGDVPFCRYPPGVTDLLEWEERHRVDAPRPRFLSFVAAPLECRVGVGADALSAWDGGLAGSAVGRSSGGAPLATTPRGPSGAHSR
jgi:hypothetical protein